MTTPIQSAKTAKEMLEAVCEDLEQPVDEMRAYEARVAAKRDYTHAAALKERARVHAYLASRYRAILKEME